MIDFETKQFKPGDLVTLDVAKCGIEGDFLDHMMKKYGRINLLVVSMIGERIELLNMTTGRVLISHPNHFIHSY